MIPAAKTGKKHHKFGWSYGTDHLGKWEKMTFEFVITEPQILQIPKVSKGHRDGSLVKGGTKKRVKATCITKSKDCKMGQIQIGRTG